MANYGLTRLSLHDEDMSASDGVMSASDGDGFTRLSLDDEDMSASDGDGRVYLSFLHSPCLKIIQHNISREVFDERMKHIAEGIRRGSGPAYEDMQDYANRIDSGYLKPSLCVWEYERDDLLQVMISWTEDNLIFTLTRGEERLYKAFDGFCEKMLYNLR